MQEGISFEFIVGIILVLLLMAASVVLFVQMYARRVFKHKIELQRKEKEKQHDMLNATIDAQEHERRRIGADIHDDIGPMLSTCKLLINKFRYLEGEESVKAHVKRINMQLDDVINRVREVAKNLAPAVLVEFGLTSALEDLCSRINEGGEIHATIHLDPQFPTLPGTHELAIYRIVQEFCNNSIKYAEAANIMLQFEYVKPNVYISMQDDGVGMMTIESDGLGIRNMHARASSINANFKMDSKPDSGTKAVLQMTHTI